MTEFSEKLERLGLSQYLDALVAEGFDTWETLLDITESDLTTLNVKLGHRRKLQRAIAEWRGQSIGTPLAIARRKGSVDESNRSEESGTETKPPKPRDTAAGAAPPANAKRKYRRHPKPDENAPERPASAYVIFSNQVRETLKGQELSFADIAKIVGERWQVLSPESREACDKQAATAKEKYYQQLAEYKKTPEYTKYQAYLADFKQKHANQPGGGGKRSKLETEVSNASTQSTASTFENPDRPAGRRSDIGSGPPPLTHNRSLSTEGYESGAQATSYLPSTSASPAMRPYSTVNSPHVPEGYSPMATSPTSTTASFREPHQSLAPLPPPVPDLRDRIQQNTSPSANPYFPPTATSQGSYIPQHQGVYDSHPRRTGLDVPVPPPPPLQRADSSVPSVPSLIHTDTSASSPSLAGSRKSSYIGSHPSHGASATSLPSMDAPKTHRILPTPLGSNLVHSPLETPSPGLPNRPILPPTTTSTPSDPRAGWSALLMASEVMSNADRRPPPEDRPP